MSVEGEKPVVCIVGGGFSGVALAWQLLNILQRPTRIVLINKGSQIGRGMAYGTPSPHHLLNVPAGRMGLSPDDEQGFLRYLHGLGLPFSGSDFVPRTLYGAYLERSLGEARAAAEPRGMELILHNAGVTGIMQTADNQHEVVLDVGTSITAKAVVLALGNFASKPPLQQPGLQWNESGLHVSAWAPAGFDVGGINDPVLLLGCGLTAFDVLLQLRHQGHRGTVTMLSRRGLLAQAHRQLEVAPPQGIVSQDILQGVTSIRTMLRTVREMIRSAELQGHDWRDVIGGLRAATPRLWKQLPVAERRRFLRHLAPYWDTHRHRAAVPIARQVQQELGSGILKIKAGRLLALRREGESWQADICGRGASGIQTLTAAMIVNCTGPSSDLESVKDPLISSLVQQGRLCADPIGIGVEVDEEYRLLDNKGAGQPGFFYVGPLLRAGLWEATAVPELRMHAARAARIIKDQTSDKG
ncbi:MAG: FAD/NAD(P)-binding protein [Gammaproteobacteria bacterium]|nr:FAD/NAD(P)-binding protein [Gammaproteobacteria bacterium]MDP2139743.1 FAD/NAD(P)-binding protein [Gammaproteobacteria bacterium]MDP2348946.1 FAD/NAD(P)-binding protein [Gammaproteobacteria bacterium]